MREDVFFMGELAVGVFAIFTLLATVAGIMSAGQPVKVRTWRRQIEGAFDRGAIRVALLVAGLLTLAVTGHWMSQ